MTRMIATKRRRYQNQGTSYPMSNETDVKTHEARDDDGVERCDKIDNDTKEPKEGKQRSVSFNRDVHVKRFGKPRERGTSTEYQAPVKIRKEPFTHLSEEQLIQEANKVLAQAQSVTCTADNPPEKFFSLPHRRKFKEDKSIKRSNEDGDIPEEITKLPLGRSTSDVTPRKKKERTSLSTLFRKSQKNKPEPVVVKTKPTVIVKRSKSDVSDLKSNTNLNKTKPIRKRSGSETEEFLKSLRNKKSQLSPIIESSPREDYFKTTSPLDEHQKQKPEQKNNVTIINNKTVNPIEKPPRQNKTPEKPEPKPPTRNKRGKSSEKDLSPSISETPKRQTEIKKSILCHEIDSKIKEENESLKTKGNTTDVAEKIKESIRKIEENVYGEREMIHSSQQPPEKFPLTKGSTVNQMVNILIKDQNSPPPMSHLISSNATNINQPFSYTKPSTSPDPNLFIRTTSPDRVPTPINKMNGKGVVYAQVRKEPSEIHTQHQSFRKAYSPFKEKNGNLSDEDEGLGYEERHKLSIDPVFNYEYKHGNSNSNHTEGYFIKESPITPRYREFKRMIFDEFEPTYANGNEHDVIDAFRGRADGMDTKKKTMEPDGKLSLDFNELSHRRELLESRLKNRRFDREKHNDPISKYVMENDPIYEAEKRMKQTEKYVNDTVKYYRHTLERDGFESTVTEDFKYDLDDNKHKYHTEYRKSHKVINDDGDRREFLDSWEQNDYKDKRKIFPPEPEYEPPSLEFHHGKPISSPDEYKEKKYKIRKQFISHDVQSGQKYRKDDMFGKRKGHYASNPEIAQEREDDYANLHYNPKQETYHNSLRRPKGKERDFKNYSVRRRDSRDNRDYYREQSSPRRYDLDNRLVDSGIENDFRLNSSGEIPRSRHRRNESDDMRNTSLFLANERQHTEDNNVSEQIYANTESFSNHRDHRSSSKRDYIPRDKYIMDDSSVIERKRYEKSPSGNDDKISAKPPKAAKKLSGLDKVKQLFSRDSSKKSKKEKDVVQPKTRTRVLKSPEHLARDDPEYRRYTDPEPSDNEVKKKEDNNERRYKYSREDLDRYRSSDSRESIERRREERRRESDIDDQFNRTSKETRMYKEHHEGKRRYHSSDRESDHRASEVESEIRKTKYTPLDSPALAERYRERRRLATPSPTPSPPRRQPSARPANNWFKSLDRLGKKRDKTSKVEKESIVTTEDESTRRSWSKTNKPLGTPSKNLRFFGDTDPESDTNMKQSASKVKSYQTKNHGTLRKTVSNSSTGLDEVDHSELSHKSYSLSNLQREEKSESPRTKEYYKRNLQNISEIQSNSEAESNFDRKLHPKPPISPYERSRSHSSSKTLKATKADVRRHGADDRSSSDLRSSKQELHREMKHRRRTPVTNSGESSTEGDSSHQSQRSVVYLHATTVGDIPDPGRVSRHRSRDDVSSVMSSNVQARTTTKSFSLFAPWTPRHHNDQYDVHYEQKPRKSKQKETVFKKSSSTKNLSDDRPASLQKNKSYSQTTLSRRTPNTNSRLSNSSSTLYRRDKRGKENDVQNTVSRKTVNGRKSKSSEILNKDDRDRVSRSVSIPKEKKAGWFKLSSKNKKQETSRVR